MWNFSWKSFGGSDKSVTFALAYEKTSVTTTLQSSRQSDSWTFETRQRNSTGSGGTVFVPSGRDKLSVIPFGMRRFHVFRSVLVRTDKSERVPFGKREATYILQWRVWSWLRMNASYRLNTCKSRGNDGRACPPRRRPAHGWVTRIQPALFRGTTLRK